MPDQGTYSLTIAPTPYSARGLARFGVIALVLAAVALALAAISASWPRAERAATGRPAVIVQAQESPLRTTEPAATPGPALVSETSSVTSETIAVAGPAPVTASSQPQTLPPPAITSAQPAAVAPAAPIVTVPTTPGQRWLAEGFVFVTEGQEWDGVSFSNVDLALSKLAARIRAQLGNRQLGQIYIVVNRSGRTLSGKQPYAGAANFFSTNDGRNELVLYPGQSVPTILHELGHAYNLRRMAPGRYALVLQDPEMQSFMAAAGWRVLGTPEQIRAARDHMQVPMAYDGERIWPRLSNDDPLEDFANSFSLYFVAPEDLRAKSPDRFAWFETNLGR